MSFQRATVLTVASDKMLSLIDAGNIILNIDWPEDNHFRQANLNYLTDREK